MKRDHASDLPVDELRDRLLNDPQSVILPAYVKRPKRERQPRHGTRSEYARHGCRCKVCKEAQRAYLRNNGVGRRANRKHQGAEDITEDQCKALLSEQGGKCAVCRKELAWPDRSTCIDHNHETGRIRGILCKRCNTGLGMLNDDPELLRRGIIHLEKTS